MIEEAIVLAGGLGTRLSSVVKDVPKPMAEVAGRPFLSYILYYLSLNKVKRVVLAVGHKYEIIQQYLDNPSNTYGLEVVYSIEKELLGTGGAIFQAFSYIKGSSSFVVNGDSYFDVPLSDLAAFSASHSAELVFALKKIPNSGRYGNVNTLEDGKIDSFAEKGEVKGDEAIINGGIYLMNKSLTNMYAMPDKFSMEQDFFEKNLSQLLAYGKVYEGIFIDIGIPQDYERSQELLRNIIPSKHV